MWGSAKMNPNAAVLKHILIHLFHVTDPAAIPER